MKPNADMITKVLHNFRVNGKFDQDQLIIGRGVDEQLQLMISDAIGIRYTPSVAGERTFTIQGTTTDNHPVFDDEVVLYPHPKPTNEFTNYYVLAEEDVIWISEEFPDPDFPGQHYVMFIGSEQSGAPHQWMLINISQGDEDYNLNWSSASPTYYFLGSQEGVTWSDGEASVYPESPNDFGTRGYLGVQPESFSMTNTEGSDAKLEYTNDGTTWYPFGESGSAGIIYEPIEFTGDDLQDDGTIHVQHDFNDKNVLCLGYIPQPKEITYLDNEIVLDYSDQNSSNLVGAVWFVNSKQEMLVVPVAPEPRNVPENLTSNTSDKNWSIMKTSVNPSNPNEGLESDDPEMFQMFDNDVSTGCTFSGSAGSLYRWNRSDLTPIKPEKLYVKQGDFLDLGAVADGMMLFVYASNTKVTSPYETGSLTEITNHVGGAAGTYEIDLSSNNQSFIYWYVMMVNAETGTIYEIAEDPIGGGVIDPEEPPDNVVVTSPIYVSGSHPTQVNCDGTYETYDGSAASTAAPSGSTTVVVYFTMDGGFQITVIQNDTTGEVTFYLMDVSSQMDDAVVYFVGHPSNTSTNHYDPTQAVWSLGPEGVDPIPKFGLQPPGVYVISGAGTADVNGTYWAVPTEEWSNIFNGTTLNNMQHCWTNGTYYLCDILSQYPYPSRTIQIMGYKYVDGVASDNMVNFYTCAPFSLDGDLTNAVFQVAHGDGPTPTISLA